MKAQLNPLKNWSSPVFTQHFSTAPRRREHDGETALVAAASQASQAAEVVQLLCRWRAEVNALNRRSAGDVVGVCGLWLLLIFNNAYSGYPDLGDNDVVSKNIDD